MAKVFFTLLKERHIQGHAVDAWENVCMRAGALGYTKISTSYGRVDVARNMAVLRFLEATADDNDVLIMCDDDHTPGEDILERLVAHNVGVVGCLAFRRGEPYDPQMYKRISGHLHQAVSWEQGLVQVDALGMAAIAIQRWVFNELENAGQSWPFFRFWYPPSVQKDHSFPSEDIYFSMCCEAANIPMYVDTSLISPHLTSSLVDQASWEKYLEDHPDYLAERDRQGQATLQMAV